jgi:CO/xanthine dehydrogenase Mo-binding subunit
VGVRYREILQKAQQHPIWLQRRENKQQFEKDQRDRLYGVGFAIATKDYGTGAAAPVSAVQFDDNGQISLAIGFMEMGTGTQTSQALLLEKILGAAASECQLAEIEAWSALQQFQTENPYTMSQAYQDKMATDPLWTPVVSMASSASMSSFFQSHATTEAAKILFAQGLLPAAQHLWKIQGAVNPGEARWQDGRLRLRDLPPIPLAQLAREAHRSGLVTGVMVHTFNRWEWAHADFELNGQKQALAIDGLALRRTGNSAQIKAPEYQLLRRTAVRYPSTSLNNAMVTYYAPAAALVEVAVDKGSGRVEILRLQNYLECGNPIVRQLVEGQIEGGVAMGIGHALYEYLPPLAEGAGNGSWNLNRYQVPLGADVAVWRQQHEILAPVSEADPHKGIGEVVMIPIVAALSEAIYQATGKRFNDTPITPETLRSALNPEV